jgi:hypothetical protein
MVAWEYVFLLVSHCVSLQQTGELERVVVPGGVRPLFQTLSYSYPTMPGTDVPSVKPVPA